MLAGRLGLHGCCRSGLGRKLVLAGLGCCFGGGLELGFGGFEWLGDCFTLASSFAGRSLGFSAGWSSLLLGEGLFGLGDRDHRFSHTSALGCRRGTLSFSCTECAPSRRGSSRGCRELAPSRRGSSRGCRELAPSRRGSSPRACGGLGLAQAVHLLREGPEAPGNAGTAGSAFVGQQNFVAIHGQGTYGGKTILEQGFIRKEAVCHQIKVPAPLQAGVGCFDKCGGGF